MTMNMINMKVGEHKDFSYVASVVNTQVVKLPAGKYRTETYNPVAVSKTGKVYGGGHTDDVMVLTKDTEVFVTLHNWYNVVDDIRHSHYDMFKDGYARITRIS